jgi:putative phosphoesterase
MHQHWGTLDRFALIADIHGNRWALEAVLADIDRRGIRTILNLGDNLFGPLDPDGTAEILMKLEMPGVAGNQDRELLESNSAQAVTPEQRNWLAGLPVQLLLGDILLFHGTPDSDHEYLLETVRPDGVTLATADEIERRLGSDAAAGLLLCGHTHIPRVVASGERLVVNPGSVGLQAFADELPLPHVMETGSPHARYAVLERGDTGWRVDQMHLRYDWKAAMLQAEANDRPDWAFRLANGRAR